jgi:hypothetical protein
MISHPRIGQVVRLRYRESLRRIAPHHDRPGIVVAVCAGRKPRNHLVEIGDELVCVPAGHLVPAGVDATPTRR